MLILKKILYYTFGLFNFRGNQSKKKWEYVNTPLFMIFPNSAYTVGIIKEAWNMHYIYVLACRELKISYYIIDIFSNEWINNIKNAPVDIFLFRPSVQYSPWKNMYDDRIKLLSKYTSIQIFPNEELLWLWESKRRLYEWLKLNNYPHIETWIFYDKKEALNFCNNTIFPVVYKADFGSGASGVKIINNKLLLKLYIYKCFGRGIRTYRKHKSDKEHGFIILQKYAANILEWRIFRMGNYYFGFQKIKKGKFHSGTHKFAYGMPPVEALNLVKTITDKHQFKHLSIDIFIDDNNQLYINEIQVYFGQYMDRELLRIQNKPGRLYFDEIQKEWIFEEGEFCKNNMANIRLQTLFD